MKKGRDFTYNSLFNKSIYVVWRKKNCIMGICLYKTIGYLSAGVTVQGVICGILAVFRHCEEPSDEAISMLEHLRLPRPLKKASQ